MKTLQHPYIEHFLHFDKLKSTNKYASDLIKTRQISGNFVVVADEQTKGMGRLQHTWDSSPGGLWFSLALERIQVDASFTLFCGMVLHQILVKIEPALESKLTIKWPNDLYLSEKKVAGILTNFLSNWRYHIVGIGLNTNNNFQGPILQKTAVSLFEEMGEKYPNRDILAAYVSHFFDCLPSYLEHSFDRNYLEKYDHLKGKKITFSTEFEEYSGQYKGVSHTGAIQIALPSGSIQPFFSGSVIKIFL